MTRRFQRFARRLRHSRAFNIAALGQVLTANLLFLFLAPSLRADDCSRDWRRAEDCLRTPGAAQTLGTTAGVVGVILVNGMAVATLVLKPRGTSAGGSDSDENPPDTQYSLDIQTTPNPLKATPDGKTACTVHARVTCSDPKVDTGGLTQSIGMSLSGSAAALAQSQDGDNGGYRYITFIINPPQPGQVLGDLNVSVSVYVEGGALSTSIPVALADTQGELEIQLNPAGKDTLTPLFKEQIWIYAKVKLPDEAVQSGAVDLQAVKSSIRFTVIGGGEWVGCGEADSSPTKDQGQDTGEFVAWCCELMSPEAMRGYSAPPEGFTVRVTAQVGENQLSKELPFKINPQAIVHTKPDNVFFVAGSGESSEPITVWIENPGDAAWSWRTEYEDGQEALADAVLRDVQPGVVSLALTEKHVTVPEGESKSSRITINAEVPDKGIKVQGSVLIELGSEGIFVQSEYVNADGTFHVTGDGKKKETLFRLRVMAWDPTEKKIVASDKLPPDVKFEVSSTEDFPIKLAEFGQMTPTYRGIKGGNVPCGEYGVSVAKALPLDTEVTVVEFKASILTAQDKELSATVKFGLGHDVLEIASATKELEVQRCYDIIRKYVRGPKTDEIRKLVDDHKDALGAEGMVELRHQVWQAAAALLMAEAQAYEDEAAWYDKAVTICEWAEWAGNLAFGACLAPLGPVAGICGPMLKDTMVSAIKCFIAGPGRRRVVQGGTGRSLGRGGRLSCRSAQSRGEAQGEVRTEGACDRMVRRCRVLLPEGSGMAEEDGGGVR